MARKPITTYVVTSDLSKEEFTTEDEPTTFAYDGVSYRIDLTPAEIEEFESLLNRYIEAAEEIPPYLAKSGTSGEQAKMRAWLKENQDRLVAEDKWPKDIELKERGRIHKSLQELYKNETKS